MRSHPETGLQIATRSLFDTILDPDEVLYLHIPNGERRDARTGALLKAMGVVPGAGDWLLSWRWPRSTHTAIGWIELKANAGTQTPAQKSFQARAVGVCHRYAVCRSLDEVLGVLEAWDVPRRSNARISA